MCSVCGAVALPSGGGVGIDVNVEGGRNAETVRLGAEEPGCCIANPKTGVACGLKAVATFRMETRAGPMIAALCDGHVYRASLILDEFEKVTGVKRLP
jgi:hypothetical protein